MKDLRLLPWLMQLGFGVAFPLIGFVWLALYLRERFELGLWVLFLGIFMGMYCAVTGFLRTLKQLSGGERNNRSSSAELLQEDK